MDGAYHILVCAQLYTGLTQPMHMAGEHLDSSESRAGNRAMLTGIQAECTGKERDGRRTPTPKIERDVDLGCITYTQWRLHLSRLTKRHTRFLFVRAQETFCWPERPSVFKYSSSRTVRAVILATLPSPFRTRNVSGDWLSHRSHTALRICVAKSNLTWTG